MDLKYMQTFLVVPAHAAVGLTSVALGIVRALQNLGGEVRFVKPVAQGGDDASAHFAREIFRIDVPVPLSLAKAAERIAANQGGELQEEIVALCMKASQNCNALVVEGLHAGGSHAFTAQLNVDIANSLKASIVVVADGSLPAAEAIAEARLAVSQYMNEGCTVAGVVFNKAPEEFDVDVARVALGTTPLWGVVHETVALRAPRVRDVAEHLGAEIVAAGEIDTRRVRETVTAARSSPASSRA